MEAELTACGKFKKAKVDFLKSQATGRINRGRTHPTVPMQYRQKNGKKVKVTPPKRCRSGIPEGTGALYDVI